MAEVKAPTISPKKIPIDQWVDAVKKVDPKGLKPEEKKIFDQVKAHKNIPKTSAKFSNFCIHNLSIKDEKLINRIWNQLSGVQNELKSKLVVKESKEDKMAKLEKKLDVKKDKSDVKKDKTQIQSDKQPTVNGKAKLQKETKGEAPKKAKESPADPKKTKGGNDVEEKKDNLAVNGSEQPMSNKQKKKLLQQKKQEEQKAKIAPKETKESKKADLEKKLKPAKDVKGASANGKVKQQLPQQKQVQQKQVQQKQVQQQQKKTGKPVAESPKKQEMTKKKKVSFSKDDGSPGANKSSLSKTHKQTPKKVELKKGKKQVEEEPDDDDDDEDDDDDDEEFSDDELSFGSDDSDISLGDSVELDGSDAEEIDFDEDDDDEDDDDEDDDDEDDEDGDLMDDSDDIDDDDDDDDSEE